jgi:hypothetical protein
MRTHWELRVRFYNWLNSFLTSLSKALRFEKRSIITFIIWLGLSILYFHTILWLMFVLLAAFHPHSHTIENNFISHRISSIKHSHHQQYICNNSNNNNNDIVVIALLGFLFIIVNNNADFPCRYDSDSISFIFSLTLFFTRFAASH